MNSMISFAENVNILGSDDVTTCVIVVVRHSGELLEQIIYSLHNPRMNNFNPFHYSFEIFSYFGSLQG